jgi:ATP-dependent exoDNAse (exonuclease V) alpha subunit
MIKLSKQQQNIHDQVIDWFSSSVPSNYLSIGGFAGTGKTTLIGFITDTLKNKIGELPIAYVTYTGKASLVLKSKIRLAFDDYAGTIHSLIYRPIIDKNGKLIKWDLRNDVPYSLIILDEASMVSKDIWDDLKSYGIPILAVGDHGQLPPIGENNFSLMKKPHLLLTEIHRQARENPIIKLSMLVRDTGQIPTKTFGRNVVKLDYSDPRTQGILNRYKYKSDSQILCGLNKTRVKINNHIREMNKFDRHDPHKKEKLICLKNNKELNIMNGQIGYLNSAKIETNYLLTLNMIMTGESMATNCLSHRNVFGSVKYDVASKEIYNEKILKGFLHYDKKPNINLFDFGYCISVHRSQGSEWNTVLLIEERNYYQSDDDYKRWLYTAITRARNRLIIIDNYY